MNLRHAAEPTLVLRTASCECAELEGDFFDFAEFPELVILDPFALACSLEQTRSVGGTGDSAVTSEQLAVQTARYEHRHDGCLCCDEACNKNGGPGHS